MNIIYGFSVRVVGMALKLLGHFNPKLKLFVQGRKEVFKYLSNNITGNDKIIWFHAASLGEYEQGLPVLEGLKKAYKSHKFLLTFFSPSGYEVKKNSDAADYITYLPLDTKRNAKRFVEIVNPELAIFIKYEVWPNYLKQLQLNKTPILLASAIFKRDQIYFKFFGGFLRKSLSRFSIIFVQNNESNELLKSIGFVNITISGDTRFDRVSRILERDNQLKFMEEFKATSPCFVAGSTWPEDEEVILDFINNSKGIKIVIAPHNIKSEHILDLKNSIHKKVVVYSQHEGLDLSGFDVLIVDTIGLLTRIYSYADVTFVGGGFKTGLHNTLEPAIFGIPVLIGPNFKGFAEAENLVEKGGVIPIKDKKDASSTLEKLFDNRELRKTLGKTNQTFIEDNLGATETILNHINSIL